MESTGVLSECFPELDAGRGCEQRPVHRFDVFTHGLTASIVIDLLLAQERPLDRVGAQLWSALWEGPAWDVPTIDGDLRRHFSEHGAALRLATLLHDVAKPQTRSVDADDHTHFYGHSEQGAAIAAERLRHWRLPNRLIDRVSLLIDQHLRPGQVASPGQPPTARALHRFQHALSDASPDLCWLFLADSLATVGPEGLLSRWPAYVAHVQRIVTWRPPVAAQGIAQLVDGRAVMEATGLAPGPHVGRILTAISEAAATGELTSEADAIALALRLSQAPPASAADSESKKASRG
jgi:putative nucleotidyltransferase with HDIG domain